MDWSSNVETKIPVLAACETRVFLQSLSALNSDTQKQSLFNWEMWNFLSQAANHRPQELCHILGVSGIVLLNKIWSY